ncbi:TlpA family protein disulfide reductase [Streptomyces zagrosensis]|uniref:Thiol-disulfide isomerase/thioredoxin n=1 Tax=Streptomyces zagrosensis TaxID=1042984 RepID=A0A7W9Q7X9_9ACTN|nr:TlpA disulfide reductase family protein [Streptomyces zagrosensis]MBB5934843.1 thiol-disulfide isomerase/thioredoxin [Streptomyces zagrosensis]
MPTRWPVSRIRTRSRRPALPTVAGLSATALALTVALTGCGSGDAKGKASFTRHGSSTIETVAKADRKPAPDVVGAALHGETVRLSDYKGKVVAVNLWASWCPPCRAETPSLVKVAAKTTGDVAFVGLNSDHEKTQATKFEKELGVRYPSWHDPTSKLALRFPKGSFNPQGIPSTLFIDREGKIAARALSPIGEEDLHEALDPLIAEQP